MEGLCIGGCFYGWFVVVVVGDLVDLVDEVVVIIVFMFDCFVFFEVVRGLFMVFLSLEIVGCSFFNV